MMAVSHRDILKRTEQLARSSRLAIHRLTRSVDALEQDVLPVHEQTRTLYELHQNAGTAIERLEDMCDKLKSVIKIGEVLGKANKDWEKFYSYLEELNACRAFLKSSPALSRSNGIVQVTEQTLNMAVESIVSEVSRLVDNVPIDVGQDFRQRDKSEKADQSQLLQTVRELRKLRMALIKIGQDRMPQVLLRLRIETSLAFYKRLERQEKAMNDRELANYSHRDPSSVISKLPDTLITLLNFEKKIFGHVLSKDLESESQTETESLEKDAEVDYEMVKIFDSFCCKLIPEFCRVMKDNLKSKSKDLMSPDVSAQHACSWTISCMDLYDRYAEVRSELIKLFRYLPSETTLVGDIDGLVPDICSACSVTLAQLPAIVQSHDVMRLEQRAATDKSKHRTKVLDCSVSEITRLLGGEMKQFVILEEKYKSIYPSIKECDKKMHLPNLLSEWLVNLCDAWETNLQAKAKYLNDSKAALIFSLNNHYHFIKRLQKEPEVKKSLAGFLLALQKKIDLESKELVQDSWLGALSALSAVHLPSSHLKLDMRLKRSERHSVKDALTLFNAEVEMILHNEMWYVEDEGFRQMLAKGAADFVLPYYVDFVTKFCNSSFSTHKDKYIKAKIELC
ncbi:exocyst complex component 7 [Guillardia theta CCMP2712]|uniref:Exocyst subunit Exo70 family protein n=1 Tax=Guillardia theta (strain CCMP2712) TaxID=905079 RepID=L1JSB5_GUITC|nr:exocyst complex component 7 [Guillardia theta CCMP2712]EKX50973.1 exocyst complex component 7 [Guillardia theta CCMP2712]|eukprot:XP_005837953.1 exocyst complex component 7 [Guillardia theta CCMP2712]